MKNFITLLALFLFPLLLKAQDLNDFKFQKNNSYSISSNEPWLFDTTYVKRIWTEPFVVRPNIDSLSIYIETDQNTTEILFINPSCTDSEEIILKPDESYPWPHNNAIYKSEFFLLEDINCSGTNKLSSRAFSDLVTLENLKLDFKFSEEESVILEAKDGNYLEALRIYTY